MSITWDRGLLLFDNGRASLNHSPIGQDRSQSTPRKYVINARRMTAREGSLGVLSPTDRSQYCSSVYEDERGNYLMNDSLAGDVIGYDATGAKVFHYDHAPDCALSWNVVPMHLENLRFEEASGAGRPLWTGGLAGMRWSIENAAGVLTCSLTGVKGVAHAQKVHGGDACRVHDVWRSACRRRR